MKHLLLIALLALTGCASNSKVAQLESRVGAVENKNECTTLTLALIMGSSRLVNAANKGAVDPEAFAAEQERLQQLHQATEAACLRAYPDRE